MFQGHGLMLAGALVFTPLTAAAQILAPGEVELSQVVASRDVDYMTDVEYQDRRDRLDIFMPKDARAVPVIVFFHGGALRLGNKKEDGRKKNVRLSVKARDRLALFERMWAAGEAAVREILGNDTAFLDHLRTFEDQVGRRNFAERALEHLGQDRG